MVPNGRRHTWRTVVGVLALVATIAGSAVPAGAHGTHSASRHGHAAKRVPGPGHIPVWAADFMAGAVSVSEQRAIRQARHFDVIVALRGTYAPYVADMKAANPNLTILVYMNGVMAQSDQGSAYPDAWFAKDAQGERVRSKGFGNYLMQPDASGWVADVAGRCKSFLAQSGYDGCFLDVLGTAPLVSGYDSALPVNPATGKVWKARAWLRATQRIAAATRDAVSPAPVFGNGLADGARYFGNVPTSSVLKGLDGAMAEAFVRDPTAPVGEFRGRFDWREDVRMLGDVARRGVDALSMTKVWTAATPRQRTALQRYALGTFLLGYQPGQGYFSFRSDHGLTRYLPIWSVNLGDPLGPAYRDHRAWVRDFQHGVVVVNPSMVRIRVGLGGHGHGRGSRFASNVTLGAHTASILTNR